MSRFHAIVLVVVLMLGAVATEAVGYGTIVGLGQNAEHERMTRRALACQPAGVGTKSNGICLEDTSIANLAGAPGTVGAVGYPDISSYISDGSYHCDAGDFFPIAGYPQTAPAAAAELVKCRAVISSRIDQAVSAAAGLLGPKDEIVAQSISLSCTFLGGLSGRAKCDTLWHFGTALHVSQDFYAHSNWADKADARAGRAVSPENPDGFANSGRAGFLDVRGSPRHPAGLVTGCFGLPEGVTCNYGGLLGFKYARVKHLNLNKDKGTIDPNPAGALGPGTTPRGAHSGNFARSVLAAMDDTADKWAIFRERLVAVHGAKKAALMICAIVRDDPVKDCQGRVIGLAIDSSGSNTGTDPQNLRITAGQSVATALVSKADAGPTGTPDTLTVVDFDDSAAVIFAPGDPDAAGAAIGTIDSSGGTFIAGGITTALGAMTPLGPPPGKSGIIVLTDGEDSNTSALVTAIVQAASRGVRVSFGFLSPPGTSFERSRTANAASVKISHAVPAEVQQAIINSGGVFGTISTAADQQTFVDLVQRRGLTALDDPDGADDGGAVALNVQVSGSLTSKDDRDTWTYRIAAGEGVKATLTPPAGVFQALELRDDNGNVLAKGSAPAGSPVTLSAKAAAAGQLRVTVGGDPGVYALKLEPDPAAQALPRPTLPKLKAAPVTVRGAARVSLSPRFGTTTRIIPRGRAMHVLWRIRATRAANVRLDMFGPKGYKASIKGKVRKGQKALSARLFVVGRRRGGWRLDLTAGGRVISSVIVRTR
jgi:von Willebrand factor type A domain